MRALFVAALLLAVLITLSVRVRYVDNYTLDTGGYDQNVVYGIVRIMNGTPLYTDPEQIPFSIVQYAPLHMRAIGCTGKLLGMDPADVRSVYMLTRLWVLALDLLSTWLLFRIGRRLGLAPWLAFGVAAAHLTGLTVFHYMRPDGTYLLLLWLHVWSFLRLVPVPLGTRPWSAMLPSVLFAALAVCTKQTGAFVFLLAIGFFVRQRRFREAIRYSLLAAIALLGCAVLCSLEGGWTNAYRNVVLGIMNDVGVQWLWNLVRTKYFLIGLPITMLGVATAVPGLRQGAEPMRAYIALGTIIGLLWALLTGLKAGMNLNYFAEHYTFATFSAATFISDRQRPASRSVHALIMLIVPVVALVRSAMLLSAFEITHFHADDPVTYRAEEEVVQQLRARGLKDAEFVALWHRGYMELFLPEHTLMDQKDIVYKSQRQGQLDQSAFHRMAENDAIDYVVAPIQVKEVVIMGHRFDHYLPYFDTDRFRVLRSPRKAKGSQTAFR